MCAVFVFPLFPLFNARNSILEPEIGPTILIKKTISSIPDNTRERVKGRKVRESIDARTMHFEKKKFFSLPSPFIIVHFSHLNLFADADEFASNVVYERCLFPLSSSSSDSFLPSLPSNRIFSSRHLICKDWEKFQ